MDECEFCGDTFDSEFDLHLHWGEEHAEDLSSNQKESYQAALSKQEKESERKKNLAFKILGGSVAVVLAVSIIPQLLQTGGAADPDSNVSFSLDGQPVLGDENANVTVVVFGDFYCPSCKSFSENIKPKIEDNYVETGKARFYYLDFPLEVHNPQATSASVAAECTYQQDNEAFWSIHDALYEEQRNIEYSTERLTDLVETNTEGLDYSKISTCIENKETIESINNDVRQGLKAGVEDTPTVYVNGKKVGGFSYDVISEVIETEITS